MDISIIKRFCDRLGYNEKERKCFREGGHRIRHVERLFEASSQFSIQAEVIRSRHCNSGHTIGQIFLLDVDGNFITKHCPKRMCVYMVSQLMVPVALINERLSEGVDPNDFHFMRQVKCLDVGVECKGYGEVQVEIKVVSRNQK